MVDYNILCRKFGEEDEQLLNCSQQEGPQTDRYNIIHIRLGFTMKNLNTSQTGDYRTKGWKGEIRTE